MAKKADKKADQQSFDYFKEVEAAKKKEKLTTEGLVKALRSDMLPASSTSPTQEDVLHRINYKLFVGILFSLIILAMLIYFVAGGGRPILEGSLADLVQVTASPTQKASPTHIISTNTPLPSKTPLLTMTPLPSVTPRPSQTPTTRILASPTKMPATNTLAPSLACRDVLSVTLDDVGQTLCVQGTVTELIKNPNNIMVIFGYQRGTFYWVTYEMEWSEAVVGNCYQITGEIYKINQSPVLVFDHRNIPEDCP
jgi:hypothetical protein